MNDRLQIVRQLKHERAQVFSALTDPAKMSQWFFAMKGGQTKVANELKPGGAYSINMEGACSTRGKYLEIVPPKKLVFTWATLGKDFDSTVTIELFEEAGGTKLVLTHELPEKQVAPHREGWTICFDHLELFLAGKLVPAEAAS